MSYKVLVDDNFHYQVETERYELAEFESYGLAEDACRKIVDDFLGSHYKEGMTVEELYDIYMGFGEDPFIVPKTAGASFSSWDYAKLQCQEICSARTTTPDPLSLKATVSRTGIFSRLFALPSWAKWILALALFSLLSGFQSAWGQRHFVAEFVLGTVAFAIYYLSIGTSIWAGYFAGTRIEADSKFWKWIVGIVVFTAVGLAWFLAASWIPGLGWRLDAIMNAETPDWDWI